ncbi:16S rRNA pseudouridine516 synthase [Caldicoprobacter guelmensis]|uniref:pseudouridine synthase n=1 Tax=Caldicoprobacter guelmensis TaxID=1170224 RepID=UPI001959DD01|nr:pseudouridine synthase [Caldicoprobacter guelmensis]MBM7582830.1 16S rRNA pseudouridine516 synthase [Caldicoprobacter guelmensis]
MAKIRLDKLLAHSGIGTRKQVKKLIKKGIITVNGKSVRDTGMIVDTSCDEIFMGNEKINYKEAIYIMMNKPRGVITSTYDPLERTVIDLLPSEVTALNPFPVGRLDKDTEGLLLITNDGELAHKLLSPKKGVVKKYYAQIEGFVSEDDARAFEEGITLEDGYRTLPARLEIIRAADVSEVYIYLTEGKYHQIKRMFKALGKHVAYLKRVAMGSLILDENLKPGEWRELTEEEVISLQRLVM